MNLKEIIEATLIELDRGTAADTVAMYADKFTAYANEAVNEIARRFKMTTIDGVITNGEPDPAGYAYFDASKDLSHACKRVLRVLPADLGTPSYYPVGAIASHGYNPVTLTITLNAAMSEEARRRVLLYGIYYTNNYYYAAVASVGSDNKTIVLASAPTPAPAGVNTVRTRGDGEIVPTDETLTKPLQFHQQYNGYPYISVDKRVSPGYPVLVEYIHVPTPMDVASLSGVNPTPDVPELPEYMHALIPLYVRAREQCGQDPSTQGTSSAYFSLFNQAVYNLQRETYAVPESFALLNYHFE